MENYKAVLLLMVIGLILFGVYVLFAGVIDDILVDVGERFTKTVGDVFGKVDGNVGGSR